VSFAGSISNVSGRCPNVTFAVDGTTIAADGSTTYKKSNCGDLENGQSVSGEGVTQPNRTVKATQLQVRQR
jgi:hypothetical protein